MVGRTGDDTRKSPIITLYEPSVGLIYYTLSGTFIHEHNTTSLGTLTELDHAASPHCYIYGGFPPFVLQCVTWHVAMISARAHINNNLYCGPTVQPCRVTTRVTVTLPPPKTLLSLKKAARRAHPNRDIKVINHRPDDSP